MRGARDIVVAGAGAVQLPAPGALPDLRPLVHEEMVSAYPLDPPLEVDIGTGATWLDAK